MKRTELIQNITQSIGALTRMGMWRKSAGAGGTGMPTHAQLGVMFMLMHRDDQGIKELASHIGISSSAMTQMVNGMVRDGLLARMENTSDRRLVHLSLTAFGKKKLAIAKAARRKMMAKMFEPLSDRELEQYRALQQKMFDHVQKICLIHQQENQQKKAK